MIKAMLKCMKLLSISLKLQKKDAASLENVILEKLEKDGLEFENCRAQSYDNAAVKSGH